MNYDLWTATANFMAAQKIDHELESKRPNMFYNIKVEDKIQYITVSTTYTSEQHNSLINSLTYSLWLAKYLRNPVMGVDPSPTGSLSITAQDEFGKAHTTETKGNIILTRINLQELEKML